MRAPRPRDRLTILDHLLLVVGASLGLWLISEGIRTGPNLEEKLSTLVVFLLGGLSIVGPPILLWPRGRRRRRFGPGELLWFSQGIASRLLWPPIVAHRVQGKQAGDSMATVCYFYGTPMMALFVAIGLLSGGWIGRGRRRPRTSRDTFGLLLGLAWACTGLYILSVIYRKDFQ